MRFIKDHLGDFINVKYVAYVFKYNCSVYASLIIQEDDSFLLYQGEDEKDAYEFMEDIMKQITGGE